MSKIGYVVGESLPDSLDKEVPTQAGLNNLRAIEVALSDLHWETTSHFLGSEIRKLTTSDRRYRQKRVSNYVGKYAELLQKQF